MVLLPEATMSLDGLSRAGTHAHVGCPDGNWSCSWGVAGDRERVWPLLNVLADVETGAFGLVLALKYSTTTKFWLSCVLD